MSNYREVLDAAQELALSDRVRLIDALWESVDPNDWSPPSEEWIAEVQRRSSEYNSGNITASSISDARKRARRKAGLDD